MTDHIVLHLDETQHVSIYTSYQLSSTVGHYFGVFCSHRTWAPAVIGLTMNPSVYQSRVNCEAMCLTAIAFWNWLVQQQVKLLCMPNFNELKERCNEESAKNPPQGFERLMRSHRKLQAKYSWSWAVLSVLHAVSAFCFCFCQINIKTV